MQKHPERKPLVVFSHVLYGQERAWMVPLMTEPRKNKGGRPRKDPSERASINFTMRVRPDLYEELRREAEREGRSISAQAERRLSQTPIHLVARMVGIVVSEVEKREGRDCFADEMMKEQCRAAANQALDLLIGKYFDPIDQERAIDYQIRKHRGETTSLLDALLGANTSMTREEILQMHHKRIETLKGLRVANEVLTQVLEELDLPSEEKDP